MGRVYLIVAFFLLGLQGIIAAWNGRFWYDSDVSTRNFLEDTENLLNYGILCELYVILGLTFLALTYSIDERLRRSGLLTLLSPAERISLRRAGWIGPIMVLLIGLLGSAGYAKEVHTYSVRYWFMQSGPPAVSFGFAGYYYLLVNFVLLCIVAWVAFAHLGFVSLGVQLVRAIRAVRRRGVSGELEKWSDESALKRCLEPYSWLVVVSKMFVTVIVLNMVTWKVNEERVGVMFVLATFASTFIGIWILGLPRYAIQYQIFKLWQQRGRDDYKDLRGPWVLGVSATVDAILFGYLLSYLIGAAGSRALDQLFS